MTVRARMVAYGVGLLVVLAAGFGVGRAVGPIGAGADHGHTHDSVVGGDRR